MPTLTLVAGPNGAGKSTISAAVAAGVRIVDPGAIARLIDAAQPARAAIPAARQAIALCRTLMAQRTDFIVESTLAGHGAISLMTAAARAGYRTILIYIALGEPELNIDRVRLRVAQGGHDVPDADIRRRHARSLSHAPEAIRLADEAVLVDNAGPEPARVLMFQKGVLRWCSPEVPPWADEIARAYEGLKG